MKRAWLSILLLAPLGCRGQFDIAAYLAEGDTADTDSSDENQSTDSSDSSSESAETETESADTETEEAEAEAETETETEETPAECTDGQLELGDGCFGVRQMFSTDVEPTDLALADFSGDGHLDLLLAGAEFRLRLGNEDNLFDGAAALSGISGTGVAVGSINDDGVPDFAAIGSSIDLQVALNGGGFFPAGNIAVAGFDGAFADVDGDTDEDLIVSGTALRVFLVDAGTWSFGPELGFDGESVRVANFDDDNDIDIALARPAGDQLAVFEGGGNGGFNPPALLLIPAIGDVEIGDLDGDGQLELLALGTANKTLFVYDVTDTFELMELSSHSVGEGPWRLAVADLDGDGQLDAVTVNVESSDLSILLGADGTLDTELRMPTPSPTDDPNALAAADLDNDGRAELVVVAPGTGRVFVLGYVL